MAFDDLTPSQSEPLIALIEALNSGEYDDEFALSRRVMERRSDIHLYSKSGSKGLELEGFTDSDTQVLIEEGYLTRSGGLKATLKAKAFQQYKLLKDPLDLFATVEEMQGIESGLDVFISHSSQDRDVAAALIDLLRAALNIPSEKVRCTSVDGYRLPAGASTDEQLRREIYDARTFIGLITPTSLQSTYVLFELGARWGASRHFAPVLASGTDAGALRHPLASLNALSCDVAAQVYQLVNDIAVSLKAGVSNVSAYQKYVEALVQSSIDGKERNLRQSRTIVEMTAEMSAFTPSEEVEFRHVHKMLSRSIEVEFWVYTKKLGDDSKTLTRTEAYRTNLLSALNHYINEGRNYYEHYDLHYELLLCLKKDRLMNAPEQEMSYSVGDAEGDITKELQRYGLARHTTKMRFDREESVFEFTEKMHRFIYWLEFYRLAGKKVSLEFVGSREQ